MLSGMKNLLLANPISFPRTKLGTSYFPRGQLVFSMVIMENQRQEYMLRYLLFSISVTYIIN